MKRTSNGSRRSGGRQGRSAPSRGLVVLLVIGAAGLAALGVHLGAGTSEGISRESESVVWEEARVRVEVLNAGGVSGMAREATERLRPAGFDVVSFGNAGAFDPERPSAVIDRVGRPEAAQAVAASLGIDNVLAEPDPNLYVDVTVVLGRDWLALRASDPGESADIRPPWDPRGWLSR